MLPDFLLNLLASLTYDLLKSLLPAAPRQEEIAALAREIHDLRALLARFGAPTVLRIEGDVTGSVIVLGDGNRLTLADDGSLSRRWQDWLAQAGSLDEARALYQAHLAAAYERHTFPLTGLSFSVFIGAIYRPPRLAPSGPWQRPGRAADAPLDLRGLLSQPHPVAVTAPLGEGKTTTLRYLTWAYAAPSEERFLPGMGEWLPIPLTIPRLVTLPPADGDPLEGWARLVCGAFSTLQPALVERVLRAGLSSPFYATLLTVGVLRARSAAGGLKQAESIRQPARLYRFFIAQTLEWECGKPNAPASLPDLETALRALAQIAWGTLGDAELRQSLPLAPLLAATMRFYRDVLGFDDKGLMRLFRMGMVSVDGYHHHIGFNTWQGEGAPPAPADAAGLRWFALALPDTPALEAVLSNVRHHGLTPEPHTLGWQVRDPSGNRVVLTVHAEPAWGAQSQPARSVTEVGAGA